MIVGIDPGASVGVARFSNGKLFDLATFEPYQVREFCSGAKRVIFEDSRLISHIYTTTANRAAALKMARNIGEIDAWCKLIVATCAKLGVPAHGISPKCKGAKLNAAQFEALTGWAGKTNQHERDAAIVAWPFRSAA
jgi:hypothetical protein